MDGSVPPAHEVILEAQEGHGEARHFETGDVAADQAAPDRDALSSQDRGNAVVGDVELAERRTAHAGHERQHRITTLEGKVVDDRTDEPFRQPADSRALLP